MGGVFRSMLLKKQGDDNVVPDRGSPQPGVNPVHHTSVTGQKVAGILHAKTAFQHTLPQVAEWREDRNCQPQYESFFSGDEWGAQVPKGSQRHRSKGSGDNPGEISFPGFVRADAPADFMPAKVAADEICASIAYIDRGDDD